MTVLGVCWELLCQSGEWITRQIFNKLCLLPLRFGTTIIKKNWSSAPRFSQCLTLLADMTWKTFVTEERDFQWLPQYCVATPDSGFDKNLKQWKRWTNMFYLKLSNQNVFPRHSFTFFAKIPVKHSDLQTPDLTTYWNASFAEIQQRLTAWER